MTIPYSRRPRLHPSTLNKDIARLFDTGPLEIGIGFFLLSLFSSFHCHNILANILLNVSFTFVTQNRRYYNYSDRSEQFSLVTVRIYQRTYLGRLLRLIRYKRQVGATHSRSSDLKQNPIRSYVLNEKQIFCRNYFLIGPDKFRMSCYAYKRIIALKAFGYFKNLFGLRPTAKQTYLPQVGKTKVVVGLVIPVTRCWNLKLPTETVIQSNFYLKVVVFKIAPQKLQSKSFKVAQSTQLYKDFLA